MTRRVMALALLVSFTGCVGPQFLKVQRYKYNEAIQESTAEQLLLNIVRLRYNDSPMFLNVGDIDARFSLEASSMASGTINENVGVDPLKANSATVTASSGFTNNPNIKLSPMQDADFARLLNPLTSDEMLGLAERRGSLYEYLALSLQSYTYKDKPNVSDATKTVDAYRHTPKWMKFLERLKRYVADGRVLIGSTTVETKELLPSYPASEIEPGDVIEAKLAGLMFKKKKPKEQKPKEQKPEEQKPEEKKDEEEYVLVSAVRRRTITLPLNPSDPLEPGVRTHFAQNNEDEPRDEDTDAIPEGTNSRSIVEMMYCLSLGVEVPTIHENQANDLEDQPQILEFNVITDDRPPKDDVAFVSVKYRGHWFYIKRIDEQSKKFFSILTELFVERAGKPATTATTLSL